MSLLSPVLNIQLFDVPLFSPLFSILMSYSAQKIIFFGIVGLLVVVLVGAVVFFGLSLKSQREYDSATLPDIESEDRAAEEAAPKSMFSLDHLDEDEDGFKSSFATAQDDDYAFAKINSAMLEKDNKDNINKYNINTNTNTNTGKIFDNSVASDDETTLDVALPSFDFTNPDFSNPNVKESLIDNTSASEDKILSENLDNTVNDTTVSDLEHDSSETDFFQSYSKDTPTNSFPTSNEPTVQEAAQADDTVIPSSSKKFGKLGRILNKDNDNNKPSVSKEASTEYVGRRRKVN